MNRKKETGSTRPLATVIMAAGKGKRMKNPRMAKVLYQVDGKPMIDYVVNLALQLKSSPIVLVTGHAGHLVVKHVSSQFRDGITFVEQRERLGTGHAVMQAERVLHGFHGDVLVLSGDVPLLTKQTVARLVEEHQTHSSVATILTSEVQNPRGYGRILRQSNGSVKGIVEDKDATEGERAINEINSGIYVFQKESLFEALKLLGRHNVQKEYYLTDVFERFWEKGQKVLAVKASNHNEVRGVNSPEELRELQEAYSAKPGLAGNI
jgi:UDP-N-acetylglucosamine diphosphorylase/glucosamine-1-phosphate N-acetyltransferase